MKKDLLRFLRSIQNSALNTLLDKCSFLQKLYIISALRAVFLISLRRESIALLEHLK